MITKTTTTTTTTFLGCDSIELNLVGSIVLIGFTGSVSTDAMKTETKLLYAQPMYVQSLLCPFAVLVLFLYTTKSLKMPFLFCFYYSDKATWKVIRISLEQPYGILALFSSVVGVSPKAKRPRCSQCFRVTLRSKLKKINPPLNFFRCVCISTCCLVTQ